MTALPCASILVCTEDGSELATEVVRLLSTKMFQLLEPAFQTHRFEFVPSEEVGARANGWQGRTQGTYRDRVDFFKSLATQLLQPDVVGYVLVHFDCDTTWADRNKSGNMQKFRDDVLHGVHEQLNHLRDIKGLEFDVEEVLSRLIPVAPCYSIEAWLYQNTSVAAAACRHRGNEQDAVKVERWGSNRAELDEVEKPKKALCIGSSKNMDLAGSGFPSPDVHRVGKSFAAVVERLQRAHGLLGCLRATYGG